jgi:hypothetical protein
MSKSTDLHPLADKDQIKHYHPSPSLCRELHPDPLRSLYSGTAIPGGRGLFPDLFGHFVLESPSEFGIQRKHLLRR